MNCGCLWKMDGAISPSLFRFPVPSFSHPTRCAYLSFSRNSKKHIVFASKNDPNLDQWDQMELKFGRMLGEDPKLTLAKVIGRKLNPEMTNMEIEKSFYKNNGKILDIEEVPFDGPMKRQSSKLPSGLNLVRPVPKKGVKFEVDRPKLSEVKRPRQPVAKPVANNRSSVPDVILRKPSIYNEDGVGVENSSRLRMKPNLSLKMGKQETKERFSDFILVRRPEPTNANVHEKQETSDDAKGKVTKDTEENGSKSVSVSTGTTNDVALLGKPEMVNLAGSKDVSVSTATANDVELLERPEMVNLELNTDQGQEAFEDYTGSNSSRDVTENILKSGNSSTELVNGEKISLDQSLETLDIPPIRDHEQKDISVIGPGEKNSATETKLMDPNSKVPMDAALIGKPKRLDQNSVKGTSNVNGEEMVFLNPESYDNFDELENFPDTSPIKERENIDWKRAEDLFQTGGREEVEIISSSTRGFVVSFGSLIGFLPYRNLAAKYKYLAFESWLRRKGLDPSVYKQNLGIIGNYEATSKTASLDSSLDPPVDRKVEGEISLDMKLEDLLMIYDKEKLKFLSSFVGQKIKVNVVLADRKSRRLIFSVKPKEKEESIERKKNLMAKLSVGDVVKCCIRKITYFGIFVEVEGVPALIHQTEVSWDATLDPESYFKIGQIVEAKVHQLDFSLERIFLSLKEITPDPLTETLEAVVGANDSLDGRLEVAQANTEWADVELLVKELEQYEGIQSVSKGRFFLSPGLAPTFQVYMASMFENQYKLLARSENRVQEVIVQTSLGKEEMKSAILTCTNRVA